MENQLKLAKVLRYIARTILLIIAVFWFVFALFSGAEQLGGGLKGIILNSPNAIAWLLLLGLVILAWKKELIGGGLIALMGILTIFFFNVFKHLYVFWMISLPLILLGGALIAAWYLSKAKKQIPKPEEQEK